MKKEKTLTLAVTSLLTIGLLSGCANKPAPTNPTTEAATTAPSAATTAPATTAATEPAQMETVPEETKGGIAEDGKGQLAPEDLLGQWFYAGQGCIMEFREDGHCQILDNGTHYGCTYTCENDRVILAFGQEKHEGEIRKDGQLYFDGSMTGFMTYYMWEQSAFTDEVRILQSELAEQGAIAGILHVGYCEGSIYDGEFLQDEEVKKAIADYPFIQEIRQDRLARNEGTEVYCIVPADSNSSIAVTDWDGMNEQQGDAIFESETGAPFLIQCNVSDLFPNMGIYIKDSNGNSLSNYHPGISLKDGSVMLPEGNEPLLIDLAGMKR